MPVTCSHELSRKAQRGQPGKGMQRSVAHTHTSTGARKKRPRKSLRKQTPRQHPVQAAHNSTNPPTIPVTPPRSSLLLLLVEVVIVLLIP
mmetsp:Transcript_54733/g.75192  ORF Transcript_54733/g.75192 Transcript_54733/m.75192 type:complete len:90 (+) Transcript_54733:513-782(+)